MQTKVLSIPTLKGRVEGGVERYTQAARFEERKRGSGWRDDKGEARGGRGSRACGRTVAAFVRQGVVPGESRLGQGDQGRPLKEKRGGRARLGAAHPGGAGGASARTRDGAPVCAARCHVVHDIIGPSWVFRRGVRDRGASTSAPLSCGSQAHQPSLSKLPVPGVRSV